MNLYLIGAGALAFVVVVTAVAYKAEQYGAAQVREQWSEERREWEHQSAALRAQKQATVYGAGKFKEDARNESRIVYRTITKSVPTYVDRPVYSQPCLDARGLSDINAALTGQLAADAAAEPDAAMPAIDAAGGRDRR